MHVSRRLEVACLLRVHVENSLCAVLRLIFSCRRLFHKLVRNYVILALMRHGFVFLCVGEAQTKTLPLHNATEKCVH